ncbi:hypothetical protein CR194_12460 [Salipaludibacillus keqinensis]|uniref:Sporulation protein n=1 Tax=Salipaludibacillus keqinensis TaxID=2045207 RepID=A0A323TBF3_9BACI|nr:hypothetical protein [Salipaludibacillus keqinensis]PYZ92479.1 hypothetical protein CR194_12460 [Salipaludibacillus keqinensis]
MKTKQIIICLLITCIFLGACNQPKPPEVEGEVQAQFHTEVKRKDWGRSLFGPGPASYGTIAKQGEPYDPATESNVTGKSFRSLNTPRQTEADDQEMIESVIYDIQGVTPGMVILIGGRAWVNVMFDENLNQQQQDQLVNEIEQKLIDANPRYDYEVIVNLFN